MTGFWFRLRCGLATYCEGNLGAAAAEFAMVLPILVIPLLNVVDLGSYAWQRMQLDNAALAGAEQVRSFCNAAAKLPATNTAKCAGLATAETQAIQSTSLGANVTAVSGYPKEAYYCTLTNGSLQMVGTAGTIGSPPPAPSASCSAYTPPATQAWSFPTAAPSDFIQVSVTTTYSPIFASVSVASLLPATITRTTMARLQ